jgi:hypothetical protein
MLGTCFALTSFLSAVENRVLGLLVFLEMPTIATITPALWLARFAHLNDV